MPTTTRPISDRQMRDAWKRRVRAREIMGANHKPICDYDAEERAEFDRNEAIVAETSGTLLAGLRERGGMFWLTDDFPLILDRHGDMVPVWPWMQKSRSHGRTEVARQMIADAMQRMKERGRVAV